MSRNRKILLVVSLAIIGILAIFPNLFPPQTTLRENGKVTVLMRALPGRFVPSRIEANKGDKVVILFIESRGEPGYPIHTFQLLDREDVPIVALPEGRGSPDSPIARLEFVVDSIGEFTFVCNVYCGEGHSGQVGKLIVRPE